MAKGIRRKGQTTINKPLNRKLKIGQHEPPLKIVNERRCSTSGTRNITRLKSCGNSVKEESRIVATLNGMYPCDG
jgi:hypothetical protein